MTNPRSTAQIAGHPIHPMVIAFPIACFVLAFASDIAFYATSNQFWATASFWLLSVGLITAAVAAATGLVEVFGDNRVRDLSDTRVHAVSNGIALLIALYNWYSRFEHGSLRRSADRHGPLGHSRPRADIRRLEGRRNGVPPPRRRRR